MVGLAHARKLELKRFSKGMLQRIGIAQAIGKRRHAVVVSTKAVLGPHIWMLEGMRTASTISSGCTRKAFSSTLAKGTGE